jgi:hypothetical protein
VRAHAAACLTNFFQNASVEHFGEHLAMPMEALLAAYYQGPLAVQEYVLGTISEWDERILRIPDSCDLMGVMVVLMTANIALQAGEVFLPYYRE